jgi:choline dehydrogenase-like flavoprotein
MTLTLDFTPAELRLRLLLRLLAAFSGLFSLGVTFGILGVAQVALPPLGAAAGAALALLAFLMWYASADVRRFRSMVIVAALGWAALAFIALLFLLTPAYVGAYQPWLAGATLLGALAAVLLGALLAHTDYSDDTVLPYKTNKPTLAAERSLSWVSSVFAVIIFAAGGVCVIAPIMPATPFAALLQNPPAVAAAAAGCFTLGICAAMVAYKPRVYGEYVMVILLALAVELSGHLLVLPELVALAGSLSATAVLTLATISFILLALIAFWRARRAVHDSLLDYLRFFTPGQFWALAAISDGLIETNDRDLLKPHEIALRVDNYLASFPAPKLALSRLALTALDGLFPFLFGLRPPLSYMHLQEREDFLNRHFKTDLVEGRGIYAVFNALRLRFPSDLAEGVMRFIMQFAYLGYYGEPKVQESIGYKPFSQRAAERSIPLKPIVRYPKLKVMTPQEADRLGIDLIEDADVVIIGSGAGGAILAERLLKQGRRVLMLEKGRYIEPEDFTENEIEMIGKLYGDNALQVTSSLRFTILQGSCVGGTTVSNNAVSFETPPSVLQRWNREYSAQIDEVAYWEAQRQVMERLRIAPVDATAGTRPASEIVNPVSHLLAPGIEQVLGKEGYTYQAVKANITDCLGCGYCNIGCKYGRKLSMLDEVLPKAQMEHGDALQIYSEAEAIHLQEENGTVQEVVVRLGGRRMLFIRNPKTVVVSGGTVASSWLLMRSGIGKHLPIGRRLSFNMGSPLHARFPQVMNAYDGLQISHYIQTQGNNDFIFETWFNPPVAQALVMPGWLDQHYKNMTAYNHMVAMGVVVGTEAREEAYVRGATLFPGSAEVVYTPTDADLKKLLSAMEVMGKILLAAGAEEVLASTRSYRAYRSGGSDDPMRTLREVVKRDDDLLLSSAHPQGGNPLGAVLDADFRVRGYRNLYVVDASVFPSSVTVNPQLTVMNLAWYAGERVV